MDFSLTGDQERLREEIVRFARQELNDGVQARDRDGAFARELWRKCGAMGLPGLPVPEDLGGMGLDPLSCVVCLEALGYGCRDGGLVFSIGAHLLAVVLPIWKFGSPAQQRRWLPPLCDGTLIGVHGMSEPGSGSDAFAMATRATPDGDGWVLSGTKTFASNGPVADVALIFALTDPAKGYFGGVTGFLVERGTRGFSVGKPIEKMGLRTSPMSELIFEDCRVGPAAVLGEVGGGPAIFVHAMDWERVCLAAPHLGEMQWLLDQAVAPARTRSQFGHPIGKFQAVSHRIADMQVRLEASRLLTYRAATKLDRSKTVAPDAAAAKLYVSESLVQAALDTLQIYGGYGYATEYDVERVARDAIGSTIYSGTSEMQRTIIARWLGL